MNNNTEVAVHGAADVPTSKAGDVVAVLFKIGTVVLVMVIAALATFAICGEYGVPMGKTVFLCVVAFILAGIFMAETLNGGRHAKF